MWKAAIGALVSALIDKIIVPLISLAGEKIRHAKKRSKNKKKVKKFKEADHVEQIRDSFRDLP